MRNVPGADASFVEPEYSARSREHAKAAFAAKRVLSEQVIALGRRLIAVRALLPKDAYRRWLRLHFDWRPKQAAIFIRTARRFDVEGFDIIDPWALLIMGGRRSSAKVAARAMDIARNGRCVTGAVARELVDSEAAHAAERAGETASGG